MKRDKNRSVILGTFLQFALCLFLTCLFLPADVSAQDWRFEPIVSVGGEFDDNATLDIRTDEEVSLEGFLADLRADIYYDSPKSTLSLKPRVLLRNYSDQPEFDSDDVFVRADYRFQGISNQFGFWANYDRESVRTAERTDSDLEIEDPDEIPDDDSGRTLRIGTREIGRLAPYWRYNLSEKTAIGADLSYVEARYEEVFGNLLNDYTDIRANLNFRRKFSNVTTGLITLTGRSYELKETSSETTGTGALVGLEHRLSEKTWISGMVGLEDIDQEQGQLDPEIVGFATLRQNLKTIRMFATYRRSISPSGLGRLSKRDSVNLNFRRRLTERIVAGLGVRAYQSKGTTEAAEIDDRTYVQLQASFLWYLTTAFAIETSYRYTVVDRSETFGERSNSNRLNLWFTYQPRTIPDI